MSVEVKKTSKEAPEASKPALPPPWDIPPFPSTSKEELDSLSMEELQEKYRKMKKNLKLAEQTLKTDEERLTKAVLRMLKKNKECSQLEEERDNSYWGGKVNSPATLSNFLDPRVHSAYVNLSKKLEERTQKYDILYEVLTEALPDEKLPTPFCQKSSVFERINLLRGQLDAVATSNYKMEHRQQDAATARAAVRLRELQRQIGAVKICKKMAERALFESKTNVKYWDLYGRAELCEQKLAELRKELGHMETTEAGTEEDELDLEDLEEVDADELPSEGAGEIDGDEFVEYLDYDVSDSEINGP